MTEYLIGSLPFFVRWFVKVDNIEGNKEQGMRTVELVARQGHYLKPFAKILLEIADLREKRPSDTWSGSGGVDAPIIRKIRCLKASSRSLRRNCAGSSLRVIAALPTRD